MIKRIKIENFRSIDKLEVTDLQKYVQIIGKNNTGKTTIMRALFKLFSSKSHDEIFCESDFGNKKEPIVIEAELDVGNILNNFEEENRERFLKTFPLADKQDKILLKYEAIWDGFEEKASEEFYINMEKQDSKWNYDKCFEVIYINAQYNFETSFNNLVKERRKYNKLNEINEKEKLKLVKDANNQLNDVIGEVESVKKVQEQINGKVYSSLFQNQDLKLKSTLSTTNIYKDLTVVEGEDVDIEYSGDGKRKVLVNEMDIEAALLNNSDKIIIILMEEPETHVYVEMQKKYLKEISKKDNIRQIITSTHSPYIVHYNKDFSIVKCDKVNEVREYRFANAVKNEFGYFYSTKVAEMLFYDEIVCVEGYSEEIFYDYISYSNEKFSNYLYNNNIGVFNVKGIGFRKYIQVFEKLGIKVHIKTDNDIKKVKGKEEYIFDGINRALSYVKDKETFLKEYKNISSERQINNKVLLTLEAEFKKDEIENLKVTDILNSKEIEEVKKYDMEPLLNLLKENNIYVSNHTVGFEGDFRELINGFSDKEIVNDDILKKLKDKKAENLYEFLNNKQIDYEKEKFSFGEIVSKYLNEETEPNNNLSTLFSFINNEKWNEQ